MKKEKSVTLYCFSPPVMIATFVIELSLAVYIAWRYKLNRINRLAIMILALLATFQLAEFNICGSTLAPLSWARLGFVAITLLPPLGLHMITAISGHKQTNLLALDYTLAGIFVLFFGFFPNAIFHELCGGNYILFHISSGVGWPYALYYYGSLIAAIVLCMREYNRPKTKPLTKQTLRWHAVGMLVFMVPTTVVNTLDPSTMAAVPSILCGFAVFYALILGFMIVPNNSKSRLA